MKLAPRYRLIDALPTTGRVYVDPLIEGIRNSKHLSCSRTENRMFQKAISRIDQTIKKDKNRERWVDIIDLAKKTEKPGSHLIMIVEASKGNVKTAEEFLKAVKQIARRKRLSLWLPFDKNGERIETDTQKNLREAVNIAFGAVPVGKEIETLKQRFGEDILELLEINRLMIVSKKTNGKTIVACVSVEKAISLGTGGSAYIIYNLPKTLSHLAGWVSNDKKDVYVVDRALGEGNGEARLSMRSRVSGTLQHELQHLFNHYFGFSLVDNEYSAYLAGFAFGRIQNKHITRLQKPDRRYHAAAQQALEMIKTALVDLGVDITHNGNRKEIAKACRGLLNQFYREKIGISYDEIVVQFKEN